MLDFSIYLFIKLKYYYIITTLPFLPSILSHATPITPSQIHELFFSDGYCYTGREGRWWACVHVHTRGWGGAEKEKWKGEEKREREKYNLPVHLVLHVCVTFVLTTWYWISN